MTADCIVDETRKTRERLFAQAGHDVDAFLRQADRATRRYKMRRVTLRVAARGRQAVGK